MRLPSSSRRAVPLACALALAAAFAAGCVAPIAVPPLRLAGAPAITAGERPSMPTPSDATSREGQPSPYGVEVRATIEPLAAVASMDDRRMDFGFGYVLWVPTLGVAGNEVHGATGEVAVHVARWPMLHTAARLSLRLGGEALVHASGHSGGGFRTSLDVELGEHRHGQVVQRGRRGMFFGRYHGETMVGLSLATTYRTIDATPTTTTTFGLTLRTPSILGLAIGIPDGRGLLSMLR